MTGEGLLDLDWVKALMAEPDCSPVITAGAMLSKESNLPADHMFTALLKVELVRDMLCLYSSEKQQFHTILTLGSNVCGHPTIVHGETLGGLNYVLKREGVIPSGPSFTVQLEISYKKPVPAESTVICTASIESIEGRKAWAKATVQSQPTGDVFALGKGLFVIPRDTNPLKQHNALEEGAFATPQTETAVDRIVSEKRLTA